MNHEEDIYHQVGENYRGIFYNQEEPEERYFEHGAHFQYNDLCRRLEKVKKAFTGSRRDEHKETEKETNCHSLVPPLSHININLNNIYINNENKSRNNNASMNHTKSRNNNICQLNSNLINLNSLLNHNQNSNTYNIQLSKIQNLTSSLDKNQNHKKSTSSSNNHRSISIHNETKIKSQAAVSSGNSINKQVLYDAINKFGKKIEIKLKTNKINTAVNPAAIIHKSINKSVKKTVETSEILSQKDIKLTYNKVNINTNCLPKKPINDRNRADMNNDKTRKIINVSSDIRNQHSQFSHHSIINTTNVNMNMNMNKIKQNNLSIINNPGKKAHNITNIAYTSKRIPLATSTDQRKETNTSKTIESRPISKNISILHKSPNKVKSVMGIVNGNSAYSKDKLVSNQIQNQSRNIKILSGLIKESKHFNTKEQHKTSVDPKKKVNPHVHIHGNVNTNLVKDNNNFTVANNASLANKTIDSKEKTLKPKPLEQKKTLITSQTVSKIQPINKNFSLLKNKSQSKQIEMSSAFTFKQTQSSASKVETNKSFFNKNPEVKLIKVGNSNNHTQVSNAASAVPNQFLHSNIKKMKPKLIPTSITSLLNNKCISNKKITK